MAAGGRYDQYSKVCLYHLVANLEYEQVLYEECDGHQSRDCWYVDAFWSDEDGHCEVRHSGGIPEVRPRAPSNKLRVCRYFWKCDFGDNCEYAHSVAELLHWKGKGSERNYANAVKEVHQPQSRRMYRRPWMEKQNDEPEVSTWVDFSQLQPQEIDPSSSHTPRESVGSSIPSGKYLSDGSAPLTRANYKKKFQALIRLEQEAHLKKLEEICNGKYFLTAIKEKDLPEKSQVDNFVGFGVIDDMKGDSINYAVRNGSGYVDITLDERFFAEEYTAEILKCNMRQSDNKLYLGFLEPIQSHSRAAVDLQFKLKTSYFVQLNAMVQAISPNVINQIVPNCEDNFVSLIPKSVHVEGMDAKQVEALQTILAVNGGAPPLLLSGPFGSGKTHILVKAVYHFLSSDQKSDQVRILVCTQQHVSANTFFESFYEELATSSSEVHKVCIRLAADGKKAPSNIHQRFWKTVSSCSINWESGRVLVVTTCSTAFKAHKRKLFPQGYFTHVFLDEGAQMREPEAIAPLCLAGHNAKLVFAGDKHQVGPSTIVLGNEARKHGLAESLIERLQQSYEKFYNVASGYHCQLLENHRCCEQIVDFCKTQFYTSQDLCTNIKEADYPLHFVCSKMELTMDLTNHDRVYKEEAEVMVKELQNVYKKWNKSTWGQKKDCSQIAIAGSTRAQVFSMVDGILESYPTEMRSVLREARRVPVFDIQGAEYRVIIVGTTEPTLADGTPLNLIESICMPHMLNTVISRARSRVVVVGNPFELLVKEKLLSGDGSNYQGFWSHYLCLCINNNTFNTSHVQTQSPAALKVCLEALKGLLKFNESTATSTEKELKNTSNNYI